MRQCIKECVNMDATEIIKELEFKAIRSSGAGGQHVNKVSSKVVLSFNVASSQALSEDEKVLIQNALASRLTNQQVLLLASDDSRSQHKNKELVVARFFKIINAALIVPKKRKPSKPSAASVKKVKEEKLKRSREKALRRKPDLE